MGEKCSLETTSVGILLLHVASLFSQNCSAVVCDQPVAVSAQPAKIR